MMLRSRLGDLRRHLLSTVHSRPIALGDQGPVVSFCFDDFPRTAYTSGGAILKSFGARGTYYAALGLMNTSNDLGDQLRTEDIDSLLADDHELGCHTFSHISCRSVPLSTFESDMQKGRDAIREMTGCDAANFAYPYGHITLHAKKRIGTQMTSCRGIYGGINGPVADLNVLRANSLYGDVDRFAEVESLFLHNRQRGGWLIFYTHDVRPNPSPFGCTPALLDKSISLAYENGFRILPVRDVIAIAQERADKAPDHDPNSYIGRP
jgi:peptidoglycan/xylan/chitin deacetylase (PgdA/CDA1 family)